MLKSKLPGAKKFKRWVTSEVLPSIRRAGAYAMPAAAPADDAMFERLWAELERKQKFNSYVGQFCNFFGWSRRYYLSGMYNLMKRAGCNVDALTLRMQAATHDYAMSTAQAVIMDEQAFSLFCKIAEYGIQRNHIPKPWRKHFMNNTLTALNNYLFEELERLNDDSLSPEQLKQEIDRSRAVTQVSQQIVNNGKLALSAIRCANECLAPNEKLPPMLEVETNAPKV